MSDRTIFWLLTATRWFPTGLVVGVFPLLATQRGLSITQVTAAMAFMGITVITFELPTSGFSDAFGRKPVLVAAGVVNIVTLGVYAVAESFWGFAAAAACMGIYRALDSGPLEAWFVDRALATDPRAQIDGALAGQGTLTGIGVAAGSLLSGALVWWHPVRAHSALLLPPQVALAMGIAHLAATIALMREETVRSPVAAVESLRRTPAVVAAGVRLATRNRTLAALIGVEAFWVTGMTVFETFQPLRLAELLGSTTEAGSWQGPVSALGWAVFSAGSALAGVLSPRLGTVPTAMLGRLLNGLGAAVMGLMGGPVALVAAYLVTYGLHGLCGPVHMSLLHREATHENRATILSLNSLVMFGAGAVAGPLLGLLAEWTTLSTAMVVAGLFSAVGVALYLPALRRHRRGASA